MDIMPDSTQSDSTVSKKENNVFGAEKNYHSFNDLINTTFNGFSDVFRRDATVQVFDFMDLGQPRFVAPINMFPHQAGSVVDGVTRNEYSNGMFNTRHISLDQVESIKERSMAGTSSPQSFYATQRKVAGDDAYTRLKFYEGDFNYTDLDILFARKYTENLRIGLAGFNKGYDGFATINNAHTSVNYNAYMDYQINKTTRAEFNFRLNHERSGVHKNGQASNFSYAGDGDTYGLRFIFSTDTLSGDDVVLGFRVNNARHKNRSRADSFRVEQNSQDYGIYLSKDFSTGKNRVKATFNINNYQVWGNAFNNDFSDTRFSVNLDDRYMLNKKSRLAATVKIEQLNNFDPNISASVASDFRYATLSTRLKALYSRRYPNPVERAFSYGPFRGKANLNSETFVDLSFLQSWQLNSLLYLETELGYNQIRDEIVLINDQFANGANRDWGYLSAKANLDFWRIKLSAGGHLLAADQTVSARQSFWGQASYHDYWFNTILIDATANLNWYSRHDAVYYNPILNRFYSGAGENASYMVLGFKIVGTVSDAELFLEMNNLLKTEMQFIEGYYNDLRKVRFGVNWVLWD